MAIKEAFCSTLIHVEKHVVLTGQTIKQNNLCPFKTLHSLVMGILSKLDTARKENIKIKKTMHFFQWYLFHRWQEKYIKYTFNQSVLMQEGVTQTLQHTQSIVRVWLSYSVL